MLRLVAQGYSNREIGERLFISGNTVANHVRAVLQKTGSGEPRRGHRLRGPARPAGVTQES